MIADDEAETDEAERYVGKWGVGEVRKGRIFARVLDLIYDTDCDTPSPPENDMKDIRKQERGQGQIDSPERLPVRLPG